MRDAETAAALRGAALLGYLEARAREELAAAATGLADPRADATPDPMLACMDWDLGIAGTVLPGRR